jgi:hypothetical protein
VVLAKIKMTEGLGRELGNLMTENNGLDAEKESHPRLLISTE